MTPESVADLVLRANAEKRALAEERNTLAEQVSFLTAQRDQFAEQVAVLNDRLDTALRFALAAEGTA